MMTFPVSTKAIKNALQPALVASGQSFATGVVVTNQGMPPSNRPARAVIIVRASGSRLNAFDTALLGITVWSANVNEIDDLAHLVADTLPTLGSHDVPALETLSGPNDIDMDGTYYRRYITASASMRALTV